MEFTQHTPAAFPRHRPLRIRAIACEVLARQVYLAAAQSPHVIDVDLLEKGLHDHAPTLRQTLQQRIDAVSDPPYDAIVLVYGLCNRATEGLIARRVPLVLARAHDCITLYLGSRERYAAQFERHPGTYYYSAEYLERGKDGRPASLAPDGEGAGEHEGMAYYSREPAKFDELVRKYGEENARYLMEVYGSWHQHYTRAAYISLPCVRCQTATACGHAAPFRQRAQGMAQRSGWEYQELDGDPGLVTRLLNGDWLAPAVPSIPAAPSTPPAQAAPLTLRPDANMPTLRGAGAAPAPGVASVAGDDDLLVVPRGMAILATFDDRVVVAAAPPAAVLDGAATARHSDGNSVLVAAAGASASGINAGVGNVARGEIPAIPTPQKEQAAW